MAIYSLNHRPIGKSTQERPYTAGAHVNYITREGALGRLDGARMPVDRDGARDFFNAAEDGSRKNGRVGDKVMLALPKELDPDQRAELVRGFADEVTDRRAPWIAAHHDKGKDATNPHCHLLFRDQDPETGKRVFGSSEKGSTQRLRDLWQQHANNALERANRPERIDARTLKAQGIDREPQIHEGPRSKAAGDRGRRPESRARNFRNGPGAKSPNRRVDYPQIDKGRTRAEHNRPLRAQPRETERDYWNAIEDDRRHRELADLRRLHLPPDGRREEARPQTFQDKLRAHRAKSPPARTPATQADFARPGPLPKLPASPAAPATSLKDALAKHRKGRQEPPAAGEGRPRLRPRAREDEREK